MYLINYIPNNELNKNGHYRLQDEWLNKLLSSHDYINQKVTFKNVFLVLIKIWRHNIPILMPNCSLYDRFSLLDTLLLLFAPFQRKIVIIHTVSKINFLNMIFCRLLRNCCVYVYSDSLRAYLEGLGLKGSAQLKLADYPNAAMILSMVRSKDDKHASASNYNGLSAIAWGNAAKKINEEKLINFIEATLIDRIIIVGNNDPRLELVVKKFSTTLEMMERATDIELAQLLKASDVNLILFDDDYDFYKSKRAASGVYLTALKFGIPSIISGQFGDLESEMLKDGSSQFFLSNTSIEFELSKALLSKVSDPFIREKISLQFLNL